MNSYQNLYYKSRKKIIDDVIKQSSNDELFKSLSKIGYPNEFDKKFNLLRDDIDMLSIFIDFLVKKRTPRDKITIENGLINVDGNVNIFDLGLIKIPHPFGIVTGDFNCTKNQLTSLEGSPKKVGGNFDCTRNQLTTLEGGPLEVGGTFYCSHNQLTTLKGSAKKVGGAFYCNINELITLQGSPKYVGDSFWCNDNQLTTLQGSPKEVRRGFYCYSNLLTTLEGAPKEVGSDFNCRYNQKQFTEDEVIQYCKVNGEIYV